ncbi:MAG: hypothetical protein KDD44_10795, partial [Bdellovibrionales bacterium]|nr:hypothetical protein [Bdellovibrionales bacterium]
MIVSQNKAPIANHSVPSDQGRDEALIQQVDYTEPKAGSVKVNQECVVHQNTKSPSLPVSRAHSRDNLETGFSCSISDDTVSLPAEPPSPSLVRGKTDGIIEVKSLPSEVLEPEKGSPTIWKAPTIPESFATEYEAEPTETETTISPLIGESAPPQIVIRQDLNMTADSAIDEEAPPIDSIAPVPLQVVETKGSALRIEEHDDEPQITPGKSDEDVVGLLATTDVATIDTVVPKSAVKKAPEL